jgi:hypothetical protein
MPIPLMKHKPMSGAVPLSSVFSVKEKYYRSIEVERDWHQEDALCDYILTPCALRAVERILAGITDMPGASKAWSLTGPYGTGKSSLALYLSHLLGLSDSSPRSSRALQLLKEAYKEQQNPHLSDNWQRHCLVFVPGVRGPLMPAVLKALEKSLISLFANAPIQNLAVISDIRRTLSNIEEGKLVTAIQCRDLIEEAADAVCATNRGWPNGYGIFIIIDEFGKHLEHALNNPAQDELFLMQVLAEFTARRNASPVCLLTILHQAFENYASRLPTSMRQEWAKIRGRFEDIAFREPIEQTVRLIASATSKTSTPQAKQVVLSFQKEVSSWVPSFSDILGANLDPDACAPLHPSVALLLGPLCRSVLGQNERSLFSFLTSSEPAGLREFLESTHWSDLQPPCWYRLDNLYDYLACNLGRVILTGPSGRRWAEVEHIVERCEREHGTLEVRIVKTIGILSVWGESCSLRASEQIIAWVLGESEDAVRAALATLQNYSLILYRKHKWAYGLWEGSDIDLNELFNLATARVDKHRPIANQLRTLLDPQPLLARSHLLETGTLRSFEVLLVEPDELESAFDKPLVRADGRIIYLLDRSEAKHGDLIEQALDLTAKRAVSDPYARAKVIAITKRLSSVTSVLEEMDAWQWVEQNTPELQSDAIARRELKERMAEMQALLERNIRIYCPLQVNDFQLDAFSWIHNGARYAPESARAFASFLSGIFEAFYHAAPRIHNELINRTQLSSSAAAAQRSLIAAMLNQASKPRLGFEGYPPEYCMYNSVLQLTGIHRSENEAYCFDAPLREDCQATWQVITAFFAEAVHSRLPLVDLYARLRRPPLGIKDGIMPVLFTAALLANTGQVALFEESSFIADVREDTLERLLKRPERFEIKYYKFDGLNAAVLEEYKASLVSKKNIAVATQLMDIVRPLYSFFNKLPDYTKRTVHGLSPKARALRSAIAGGRDPGQLLLEQIPVALGYPAFLENEERWSTSELEAFFTDFRLIVQELNNAYTDLLHRLETILVESFSVRGKGQTAREFLSERASKLKSLPIEPKFKAFLNRLCDSGLEFNQWLESVIQLLADKPSKYLIDADKDRYVVQLTDFVESFKRYEELMIEARSYKTEQQDDLLLWCGVIEPDSGEKKKVVRLPIEDEPQINTIVNEILQSLGKYTGINGNPDVGIAAVARTMQYLIDAESREGKDGRVE